MIPRDSLQATPEASFCKTLVTDFRSATEEGISEVVAATIKTCELDPLPPKLLKDARAPLTPVVTRIANKSVEKADVFPPTERNNCLPSYWKKPSLNKDLLKNYRSVSKEVPMR